MTRERSASARASRPTRRRWGACCSPGLPDERARRTARARRPARAHGRDDHVARRSCARRSSACARQGYALVDQELEAGLRSIAAPIRDRPGRVVAAVNLSAHASRTTVAAAAPRPAAAAARDRHGGRARPCRRAGTIARMSERFGVIGAGILGLAIARRLLELVPDATVTVLEKEPQVGFHQTGHNSGVVHAGLYYAPGSLKATLCRRGDDAAARVLRRARAAVRRVREARRRARRPRARPAGRHRAARDRQRGARPAPAERRASCGRSSRTSRASRRCTRRARRSPTSRRSRAPTPPT